MILFVVKYVNLNDINMNVNRDCRTILSYSFFEVSTTAIRNNLSRSCFSADDSIDEVIDGVRNDVVKEGSLKKVLDLENFLIDFRPSLYAFSFI